MCMANGKRELPGFSLYWSLTILFFHKNEVVFRYFYPWELFWTVLSAEFLFWEILNKSLPFAVNVILNPLIVILIYHAPQNNATKWKAICLCRNSPADVSFTPD